MTKRLFKAWVRGAGLAPVLAALIGSARAQGTIVYATPVQPAFYGPVDGAHPFDLDSDGTTDFILAFDIGGARFLPSGNNSIIVDGGGLVVALDQGASISTLPNPPYQWSAAGAAPVLGGQAVFDGMYFYSGNFSGRDAYVGLSFQSSGATHYGWMELNNNVGIAAGQVIGWAYETRANTPIFAGSVPEPSSFALFGLGAMAFLWLQRRRSKSPQIVR